MATAPAPAPAPSPQAAATLLDQLRRHLESELAVQKRLLAIAEQMGPRLLAGDAAGVSGLVQSQDEPAREAARLGTVRSRLIQALAAVFQLQGEVTMSRVLPKAPEAVRGELDRLRREIADVCQRLGRQAERNLVVARQGLTLIRDVLGDAMGAKPASAYDRRGMLGAPVAARGTVLNIRG